MEQNIEWTRYIGSGCSSTVYANEDKTAVLKTLQFEDPKMLYPHENIDRSIRLWNEINYALPFPAYKLEANDILVQHGTHGPVTGMVAPFVDGSESTDEEISAYVKQLYHRTGRILLDAATAGNCLTQSDGLVVCVDIDLALKLDRADETKASGTNYVPRKSFLSLECWDSLEAEFRKGNIEGKAKDFPLTVRMLKALIFLKSVRPDIEGVDFLDNEDAINLLVEAYEQYVQGNTSDMVALAQDFLEQECPPHLSNLKSKCANLLTPYLTFEKLTKPVLPSIEESKMKCQTLIKDIKSAATSDAIIRYIELSHHEFRTKPELSRLTGILWKCLLVAEALYYANNRKSLALVAAFFSPYIYRSSNLPRIILIHAIDLFDIGSQILVPVYFLEIFSQNISHAQIFALVVLVLLLAFAKELKNRMLVDLGNNVVEKFTRDLLEVGFNRRMDNVKRFSNAFTPEYREHVSSFVKKTFGELLPSYASLVGFSIAIAFKDQFDGGFAACSLFLYLGYTYFFLNPKYSASFKVNLAESQILYDQLHDSLEQRDLIKFYDRVEDEKAEIYRTLENTQPASKTKSSYGAQLKAVSFLLGSVTFLIGAIYWYNTYQQSSKSTPDYLLLFYYLYRFTMTMIQLSPLMEQILPAAEYSKRSIQYTMWSEGRAQKIYKETLSRRHGIPESVADDQNKALNWQLSRISFSRVWYLTHQSTQSLKELSFSMKKNDFFAFVSEDRGGPSALIRLLRRDAFPLKGEINFHPVNIKDIDEQSLNRFLAIIDSKDNFIQGQSWFETIKYGNKNATDEQVLEAAKEAELLSAKDSIMTLKSRFIPRNDDDEKNDSRLIEKRRLAIARAIVKGGLVLILDNPTAGLTYPDEMKILKTLIRLSSQLTTILVTDKLYLLDHYAHKIFYLKHGVVEESGTYDELTAPGKKFHLTLLKQREILQDIISPPSILYTIIESETSVFEKNFRPGGYAFQLNSSTFAKDEDIETGVRNPYNYSILQELI